MKLKLRERLLIPLIFMIIIGMGISIVVSNHYARGALSDLTKNQMIQTVTNTKKLLNAWISKHQGILETMSEIKIFQKACDNSFMGKVMREEADKRLKVFNIKYNEFDAIFIADRSGKIVSASKKFMEGIDLSKRAYFHKVMSGKSCISNVIKSKSTGRTVFTLSFPLKDNNEIVGMLTGTVSIVTFTEKFVKDVKIGKSGYIYMTDETGKVIYHPVKKLILKASLADYQFGKEILAEKQGLKEYKWKGEDTIAVFEQSDLSGWFIVTRVLPDEIYASVAELKKINIGIAVVTVLFLSLAIILLTQFIILKPVNLAVSFAKTIASGDLTAKMELNQSDELGELVSSLNGMGDRLKELFQIATLRTLVENLSSDSANLKEISLKMTKEIENSADKAHGVSDKSTEISDSIKDVALALGESAENISAVAAGAEQMTATIQEIAENTEKTSVITKDGVEKANTALSRISLLGEAANEIGAVTEVIKDISEQTNLLALNATIEAARAGEAGKGFAVVAGEIKALAQQTAEATSDIASKIKNIQVSTVETVDDINGIGSTIDEIDSFVTSIATAIEEQSVTTKEIAGSVQQASANVIDVNETMGDKVVALEQITGDISDISEISEELKKGSLNVNQSSVDLDDISSRVRELVGRFKI